MTDDDRARYDAELEKLRAQIRNLEAETANFRESTRLTMVQIFWYPMTIAIGLAAAFTTAGFVIARLTGAA